MASGVECPYVKLLLDEMVSLRVATQLRHQGHDTVAVGERPELRGLPDPDLFDAAQIEDRVLVTYNWDDFLALDRQFRDRGRVHHGIVIINPHRFPQGDRTTGGLIASLATFLGAEPPYPGFVHWLR